MTEVFLRRGYWQLGYSDGASPDQESRRDTIVEGDRIAIKRMLGQGSSDILIRSLGIVKEIDTGDGTIYVDWLVNDLDRKVVSKGCYKSIHGPFSADDDWIRMVFCL